MTETRLILLVEDSKPDAELVQHAMAKLEPRCDFVVVQSGDEALRYLLREPPHESARSPDLVLLDLNIPGTDGREVLHMIRQKPSLHGLPVVALTTSESPRDVEETYRLHVNSYITKPADFERFVETMRVVHQYWFRIATLPPRPGTDR